MGGLRRHLPLRLPDDRWSGCLAIAGIPPFSGFFSKDEILADVARGRRPRQGHAGDRRACWRPGSRPSTCSASTSAPSGAPSPRGATTSSPHPARWSMSVPVVVLAVLAAVGGWIQVPAAGSLLDDWLEPVAAAQPLAGAHGDASEVAGRHLLSVTLGLIGDRPRLVAVRRRPAPARAPGRRPPRAARAAGRPVPLRRGLRGGGRPARARPGRRAGATTSSRSGVQGGAGAPWRASLTGLRPRPARPPQTGLVRSYAFAMVAGAVIVGVIFVLAMR